MNGKPGWGLYHMRLSYGLMMRDDDADDDGWYSLYDACGQPLKFPTLEQAELHGAELLRANAHAMPHAQIIVIAPGKVRTLIGIRKKGGKTDD